MKICSVCNKNYKDSMKHCPYDGNILEFDPLINSTLDEKYLIESRLGKGGMGIVYRVQYIPTQEIRAIKVLLPEVSNLPGVKERFFREGKAAQRIHHPNVVKVYDIETTRNSLVYMAMEYIDGHMLSDEVKNKGRFSPMKAFILLEPIAEVLAIAHSSGVVHRDLKPENIMISKAPDGRLIVKLLDLGIAKLLSSSDSNTGSQQKLTKTGQALGTPFYMSPEQWGETPKDAKEGNWEIDGRADIYSLGIIFYELIAGDRPFQGPSLLKLATQHITYNPPPLHERLPEVPEAFSRVIERAMAKDRNSRPSTAEEFANELRVALGMAPVTYIKEQEAPKEDNLVKQQDRSSIDRIVDGVRGLFRKN
jgi:eukaryotic-like serine/threonine-protein kinase